jgi:hypothetical protein
MRRMVQWTLRSLIVLLVVAGVFAIWLYFEIWKPNRLLVQTDWWQRGYTSVPHEEVRAVCHKVLSHRFGNHHDAFVALGTVGNVESIPYLIRALR